MSILQEMRKNETNNGKKGGLLKGKAHYDENGKPLGGIKAIVTDTKTPVELEGGEVIINKEASKKYWRELSKINQSAGNGVPIKNPNRGDDEDPEEYKEGGRIISFNPNHLPNKKILNYAKKIKSDYPKVWDLGGNIFGNEAFKNLQRVSERGYWLESEKWMYIKWRSFVARHTHDFRIKGVVAMLKWVDKVDKGWQYMKDLIEAEIEKRYPSKIEKGGQIVTYKNKFNKKYGFGLSDSHSLKEIAELTKIKLSALQDIYDKGIGAYKTNPESVRPNVKSKEQWAMARVYSAVMGGKASVIDKNELSRGMMEKGGKVDDFKEFLDFLKTLQEQIDEDEDEVYLAPNGKPSNLTPAQYKLVRTKQFKNWFGDWENDPKNASKVIDENGEPLVVYREIDDSLEKNPYNTNFMGIQKALSWKTDISVIKNTIKGTEAQKGDSVYNIENKKSGIIISKENYLFKIKYDDGSIGEHTSFTLTFYSKNAKQKNIISAFLNIRIVGDYNKSMSVSFASLKDSGIIDNGLYKTFCSNQVKLADGTNTTFDGRNDDIRYEDGGLIQQTKMKKGGNIEDNIDQLIGRYVDYYFMGKNEPVTNKIESVEITPSKYNIREVKIYTEDELMDVFPLSKLEDFMNGEEVKIDGKGGDAYVITLRNMMEQGGALKKKNIVKPNHSNNEDVSEENAEMVRNQNKQILHHTEELKKALDSGVQVPAWVVAKINRATNDMSDATHYLDGTLRYAYGGNIQSGQVFDWTKYGVENTIAVTDVKDGMVFYRFNGVPKVRGMKEFVKLLEEHNLNAGFQFKQGGELEMGIKEEQEHINIAKDLYERKITPSESAEKIAKDHLKENPNYYSELGKKINKNALVDENNMVDLDTKSDVFLNSIIFHSDSDYILGGFNLQALNRIEVKGKKTALNMAKLEAIFSDRLESAIEKFKSEIITNSYNEYGDVDNDIDIDISNNLNNLFETYLGYSHKSINTEDILDTIKMDSAYLTWLGGVEKRVVEFESRLNFSNGEANYQEGSKVSLKDAIYMTYNSTLEEMFEQLRNIIEENTI